ncbi:MAG: M14 family metallopeptidase [Bacteroidetes bacterium]|nr:M14 family metallopeptidase [Bacteroidota bacterium]
MKKLMVVLYLSFVFISGALAQLSWPEKLLLTPEKTDFQKTSTHLEVMNFLNEIQLMSKNVYVFSMGKSLEGKEIPVAVLAKPLVKSAAEAKLSGKTVIYIQGNIHAGEVEGKESVMMLMRDILLGDKQYMLDSLIVIFVPIYNTDSNDKMAKGLRPSQEDSPIETGERESSEGYDLNRDGMKFDAKETRALFTQVINPWDPQIFVDLHTTNGTWHAYSLTWAPSFHSAGEIGPFEYSYYKILPSIADSMKSKYNLLTAPYGDYYMQEGWPPKNFYSYNHHPRYLVNQFGYRNRMSILSEAFAHERFYQRIHSTYSFVTEILNYANSHATEIREVNKNADKASIDNVLNNAGKAKKGVKFAMKPLGQLYHFITYDHIKFKENDSTTKYIKTGKIVSIDSVTYHAKFEAVKESMLPRGYIIPKAFKSVIDNLEMHGIKVTQLTKDMMIIGDEFMIDSLVNSSDKYQKHYATTLYGQFISSKHRFKKGDYMVDMAQPLSNLIFYLLEPQSDDGLAYWNFFDEYIKNNKVDKPVVAYPVFKFYQNIK